MCISSLFVHVFLSFSKCFLTNNRNTDNVDIPYSISSWTLLHVNDIFSSSSSWTLLDRFHSPWICYPWYVGFVDTHMGLQTMSMKLVATFWPRPQPRHLAFPDAASVFLSRSADLYFCLDVFTAEDAVIITSLSSPIYWHCHSNSDYHHPISHPYLVRSSLRLLNVLHPRWLGWLGAITVGTLFQCLPYVAN